MFAAISLDALATALENNESVTTKAETLKRMRRMAQSLRAEEAKR